MRSLPLILLLLTGCYSPTFTAYTRYHTQRELASYHVLTPDPRLHSVDYLGQSIYFEWFIPKTLFYSGPASIDCYVRLKNLEERCFSIPIDSRSGHTQWYLMGYDWYNSCGIFTYRAHLIVNDQIIKTIEHPLYTQLILPSD